MEEILTKYTKWLKDIHGIDINECEAFAKEFCYDYQISNETDVKYISNYLTVCEQVRIRK